MPNLNIYLVEGFSNERKAMLLARMTDIVVETLAASKESVRIFLVELAKAHVCVAGVTLAETEAAGAALAFGGPTVHAFLIAGRTERQKEALIGGLTRVVGEVLAIPPEPVRVMIFDVANTDFGIRGFTARSLGR